MAWFVFVCLVLLHWPLYSLFSGLLPFLHSGVIASIGAFCVFGMLQFRDSLLLRPHPALWRVVLSFGVVYQLFLVFLLFQVIVFTGAECQEEKKRGRIESWSAADIPSRSLGILLLPFLLVTFFPLNPWHCLFTNHDELSVICSPFLTPLSPAIESDPCSLIIFCERPIRISTMPDCCSSTWIQH